MCVGDSGISHCKKMYTFQSICVQCPLHLQMIVTTKLVRSIYLSTMSIITQHSESMYNNRFELLPSGVSVASKARPIIVFYSRFRDICIYIYIYIYVSVCTCIAQDRAHLTQVLTSAIVHWNTGCCWAHHFEESPFH